MFNAHRWLQMATCKCYHKKFVYFFVFVRVDHDLIHQNGLSSTPTTSTGLTQCEVRSMQTINCHF